MEYRESNYFNQDDYFLVEDLKSIRVMTLEKFNGFWWTLQGLRYKATSVKTKNTKEIIGRRVKLKDLDYYGRIVKFKVDDVGIIWDSGEQVRRYGLANFWNNFNNIEIES